MSAHDEALIIAALVAKLGGEVHLSDADLLLASELELQQMAGDSFRYTTCLRVRSAALVEGVLVDAATPENEGHTE